jgi:hypothetical protein
LNGGLHGKKRRAYLFLYLYPKRGLKERGLNIEITVSPFLPLPSQSCCRRGGNCRG